MYQILNDRAIIEITGGDSLKFLQSLVTNDIAKQEYCYTYMLNNKGRYLFDFFVNRVSNSKLYIDIAKSSATNFMKTLNFYKLRLDVKLNNLSNELAVIYKKEYVSETNEEAAIQNDSHNLEAKSLFVNKDTRYHKIGYRIIAPIDIKIDTALITDDLYLQQKYNFAIPDGDKDLIYEKSVPLNYGAEELCAISYTKGCYIGQELISKTKYSGVVRKKIFLLSLVNTSLESNLNTNYNQNISFDTTNSTLVTLIFKKNDYIYEQEVGFLCSHYKNKAIAIINEEMYNDYLNYKIKLKVDDLDVNISTPEWRS